MLNLSCLGLNVNIHINDCFNPQVLWASLLKTQTSVLQFWFLVLPPRLRPEQRSHTNFPSLTTQISTKSKTTVDMKVEISLEIKTACSGKILLCCWASDARWWRLLGLYFAQIIVDQRVKDLIPLHHHSALASHCNLALTLCTDLSQRNA